VIEHCLQAAQDRYRSVCQGDYSVHEVRTRQLQQLPLYRLTLMFQQILGIITQKFRKIHLSPPFYYQILSNTYVSTQNSITYFCNYSVSNSNFPALTALPPLNGTRKFCRKPCTWR
jgi:hypothetical protein